MKKLEKLTLNKIVIEKNDILRKSQLNQILGGYDPTPNCPEPYMQYCYQCMGGAPDEPPICGLSMDGIYDVFAMICPVGGMLWEC